MIEAEPGGTVLASLARMIDSDRLAVVRVQSPESDLAGWRCELAGLAIEQLGHPYDYSFDLDSPDRLSCAEVLTHTFQGVTWQARLLFGRPTVLPDDVVRLALAENSGVALVAYFAGGANSGWSELHADDLASELRALCGP
ncbi:MAG: YiiX/YebB-like N1pC/P60 family cysteine hydrolase [Mesorhizobium sp.]|nr:YiiX/YebB-like N1pC/P60 family cysteine hydrolase [Mesorhizobium sp.]